MVQKYNRGGVLSVLTEVAKGWRLVEENIGKEHAPPFIACMTQEKRIDLNVYLLLHDLERLNN